MTMGAGLRGRAHGVPEVPVLEGTIIAARQLRAAGRRRRRALRRIGVGFLRSRAFREQVIVGVIVLAALVRLARESQARTLARLAAWDQKQDARRPRPVKAGQPGGS